MCIYVSVDVYVHVCRPSPEWGRPNRLGEQCRVQWRRAAEKDRMIIRVRIRIRATMMTMMTMMRMRTRMR